MTVYEAIPVFDGVIEIKLPSRLHDKLNNTKKVKERLMKLNGVEEDMDSDFIADFNYQGGFLFGTFARLKAGEKSAVLVEQLENQKININKIVKETDEKTVGSLKSSSFFCLYDNLLILNLAHWNVRALETYINWFFRQHKLDDNQIKFKPKKNTANSINLKDIKSIQLAEAFITPKGTKTTEIIKFEGIKEKLFKSLFKDTNKIDDYAWEDIISATVTLTIRKRDLKKENSDILDTTLRLVNSDDVIITTNNDKRIKGTEFLLTVERMIERTGLGYYNERQIETEMQTILKAVKNGKVVS